MSKEWRKKGKISIIIIPKMDKKKKTNYFNIVHK